MIVQYGTAGIWTGLWLIGLPGSGNYFDFGSTEVLTIGDQEQCALSDNGKTQHLKIEAIDLIVTGI